MYVYDGMVDIVGVSVYIIDKDIYKELFVGIIGAVGILFLIIIKGEYVVKIVYGEGDEDVKNYVYVKLNVLEDF